ncbi:MAG: TonB-dependent receptor plug domain-containing protein [Bacteroidaceae bacterium]|nr:TonB-dependent receptor plug domain-containing protein [Bacteroidaceae bacterium]
MNFLFAIMMLFAVPEQERIDSVLLEAVDIVSSVKISDDEAANAYSVTTLRRAELENRHISSVKELSATAPNFYQPDYGSRMTSSIYVRGFGSRIDQPVVGMNVDGVPVMNKNNYDFELFDIDRVQVMRGAQGVLYGRNTSGGMINLYTMSPLNFQGKRFTLEYGSANNVRVKASHYAAPSRKFGWAVSMLYNHSDGYFLNEELGKNCDGGDNAALRLRLQWLPAAGWSIDNTLTAGYTAEGGWAYRHYNAADGSLAPVAYNDECTYRRFNISEGLVVKRKMDWATLSSTTGYMYADDRMRLDNDFLPLDYFSLGQYQKEHSLTEELVLKVNDLGNFSLMGGLFGFYKHTELSAPVHFKKYGIDNLILKNANEEFFTDDDRELSLQEDNFVINDDFIIPAFGVAAFVQGGYSYKGLEIKAGLRADYEYSMMDYNSYATVNYSTYKDLSDLRELNTVFKGRKATDAFELLPSLSVSYGGDWGNVYVSARKGFKAGGFNTQLFSDILKERLGSELLGNTPKQDASLTVYKPEENWTFELGTHLSPLSNGNLDIMASLFYIDCRNQQLTVFPQGMGTGRMMSNAGRSFSCGAELGVRYIVGPVTFDANFGYTHAEFIEYNRGDIDLSGKVLPYAPSETISANIAYRIPVPRSFANFLVLNVGWNAIGRTYWNEENTLSQPFYDLFSASLVWEKGHWGASIWGKNLLNEKYNTFYFRSIGNDFFAQGKPLHFGVSLHINL